MPLDNPPTSRLESRLRREIKGDVLFDRSPAAAIRPTRRSTRSSRLGVVVAKDKDDIAAAIQIAREEGVPVLPRGGGTSQCGQTVNRALVVECSKYMQGVGVARHRGAAGQGPARRRHGAAQRQAAPAQTVVPGRCLDRRPRHDRRHDRQQFLRRALDPLRQHGAQRARDRRAPRRRHRARISARCPAISARTCSPSAIARWCATCARCTAARPTRSTRASPNCCARSAATTST